MRIEGASLMDVAQLAAIAGGHPLPDDPTEGIGLALGFLRAADVYSHDLDPKAHLLLAGYAALMGRAQPSAHEALRGVEAVAVVLHKWAPGRPLSEPFLRSKCSHARAVGIGVEAMFEKRRQMCPSRLDGMGLSLYWHLRAAKRTELAPEVVLRMLGGNPS